MCLGATLSILEVNSGLRLFAKCMKCSLFEAEQLWNQDAGNDTNAGVHLQRAAARLYLYTA
jgi:hypothetical protein